MSMQVITVVPLAKGSFKEELTYFSNKEIPLFGLVNITLRNKKILGLVIATRDASTMKTELKNADFNLKKITSIKEHSLFSQEFLQSALETAKYFVARKSDTISYLIPEIFKEEYDKIAKISIDKNITSKRAENIKTEKLLFQADLEERVSYYKTLIRGHFAKKESVFLVCPTISHINFFVEKLSKGIDQFTFIFHGEKTSKKNIEDAKRLIEEEHPVLIIATAPYLCLPTKQTLIIMEAENSNAYKSAMRPNIDLRLFVELFARKTCTKLIMADTLIRFETLGRREIEGFGEVRPISFRENYNGEIKIVDKSTKEEAFRVFPSETLELLEQELNNHRNVFIFSLRKGLGTMTICRDCGEAILCSRCLAPLVLYLSKDKIKRMFVCNKCGIEENPKTTCKNCGGWNLESFGIGTDTCREELEKAFPKTKIYQLDKQSVKNATGARKIIEEFEKDKGTILVGTEMALMYLNNKVDTSIIASFDSLWSIPNYKMSEKIIAIVLQMLSKTEKTLLIHTRNPEDEAVQSIIKDNIFFFAREELLQKKELGYPPYKRFIKISHTGDKKDLEELRVFLESYFTGYNPVIYSAFIEKIKDKYLTNTLIKLDTDSWSLHTLNPAGKIDEALHRKISALPASFKVEIDPEDLL